MTEKELQQRIRLEAQQKGMKLWRNNLGAAYLSDGTFLRYGLANESKALNEVIKSGDLIGIRPIIITHQHVGMTIGQFISFEIKHSNWKYKGTRAECAQENWINLINSLGGNACFITKEGVL